MNDDAELATGVSATGQARRRHTQARAIVRDLSTDPEARALEGLGQCRLQHATPARAPRTGGRHSRSTSASQPRARRVQTTLDKHRLAPTARSPCQQRTGYRL